MAVFNFTSAVRAEINKVAQDELERYPSYADPTNLELHAPGGWSVNFGLVPKSRKVNISYYPPHNNIWRDSFINQDIVADVKTILEANITARPRLGTRHPPAPPHTAHTAERLAGMDYKSILKLHSKLVAEGKIQKLKGMKRDRDSLVRRILNVA